MKTKHWIAIGIIVAISFFAEFVLLRGHGEEHWWSSIPAFYALWGFVGCIVIIFVSKLLGKLFIQQSEDYYDSV